MRQVARTAVLFLFTLATSLFAQRDLATLVGTVTDPQGAAVSGAKVLITEDATGLTYESTAGSGGEYTRVALKPGIYRIEVSAPGFKKASRRNLVLTAGDRSAADVD